LTHICKSTTKKASSKKRTTKIHRSTALNFSCLEDSRQQNAICSSTNSTPAHAIELDKGSSDTKLMHIAKDHSNISTEGANRLDEADTIKTQNKNRICIFSTNKSNKILSLAEQSFQNFQLCHYLYPNVGVKTLLNDLSLIISNYTKLDYCIILIGEEDF
jgi:hypothetical protein